MFFRLSCSHRNNMKSAMPGVNMVTGIMRRSLVQPTKGMIEAKNLSAHGK